MPHVSKPCLFTDRVTILFSFVKPNVLFSPHIPVATTMCFGVGTNHKTMLTRQPSATSSNRKSNSTMTMARAQHHSGLNGNDQTGPASAKTLNSLIMEREDAFKRCQEAGKNEDYTTVLATADEVFRLTGHLEAAQAMNNRQRDKRILASINGYKGFALMKQGLFSSAVHYLERSKELRQGNSTSKDDIAKDNSKANKKMEFQNPRGREMVAVDKALKHCYAKAGEAESSAYSTPDLVKYPRTTHLFDSGGTATTNDDLVLPDLSAVLSVFCDGRTKVIIEEKVDGSNLGISKCPVTGKLLVQNRSHYISNGDHIQYGRINEWIEEHRQALDLILEDGSKVLYGEWVVARHSIPYKRLPGLFVAFDIYDKQSERFYSRTRFHTSMRDTRIPVAPTIQTRTFGPYTTKSTKAFRKELLRLLDTRSVFRSDAGTVEGVVLRVDEGAATGNSITQQSSLWLEQKFKIVRPDFLRGCGDGHHWSTRKIEKQIVDYEFAEAYLRGCYVFATHL